MNHLLRAIAVVGALEFSHGFTTSHHASSRKPSASFMVSSSDVARVCEAKNLVTSLVEDKRCFSTEAGAKAFREICSADCVFEDCYEPEPFVGKEVRGTSTSLKFCWLIFCMALVYAMSSHFAPGCFGPRPFQSNEDGR